MIEIIKSIRKYSTDFLEMWENLWYWWNESNNIIYDTLVEYKKTEIYDFEDFETHIYDVFSWKDEKKFKEIFKKNWQDPDKASKEIYNLFKKWKLNYIPYFHIIYSVLENYLNELEKWEIDEIVIISD